MDGGVTKGRLRPNFVSCLSLLENCYGRNMIEYFKSTLCQRLLMVSALQLFREMLLESAQDNAERQYEVDFFFYLLFIFQPNI